MNIRKFKETVSAWNGRREDLSLFRTWCENCYELFSKQLELEIADNELLALDDVEAEENERELRHRWEMLDIQIVINLYSKMGWKIDDSILKREIMVDDRNLSAFYEYKLADVMEKLKLLDDDIEFCYGILSLAKQIDSSYRYIYQRITKKIFSGLREFELEGCLALLNSDVKKVFVAMWFDDSMKKARENINEAIKSCGYEPMLIDMKEHNNQIVPEIFKEIDDSEFVIADLTGHRGGVYYEAGYAMAKGKTVILSCRNGEEIHFDVAQINTIYWQNEEDLFERLMRRIKATVGENI